MQTAAIIHKSPLLKCSENKSAKLPFNRTRITPRMKESWIEFEVYLLFLLEIRQKIVQ